MTGIRTPNQSTRGPAFPQGAPLVHFSDGPKLIGKTITLTSGALVGAPGFEVVTPGALATPNLPSNTLVDGPLSPTPGRVTNFNIQGQILSWKGEAAHLVVSTRGKIQQPGAVLAQTYPLACFVINWTIGGTNFETRVDGNSDQFLGIVAEQVTVTGKWDEENGATQLVDPRYYPAVMNLAASLSRGDGIPSKAFRTRLLPTDEDGAGILQAIEIPYAAKGYIIRNSPTGNWRGATAFQIIPGVGGVDLYTGAEVVAAHGRGEYLSVPSVSDFLVQAPAAAPAGLGSVEFLMQM